MDDRRNTDHAWIEASVFNYHDPDGNIISQFISEVHIFLNMRVQSQMFMFSSLARILVKISLVADQNCIKTALVTINESYLPSISINTSIKVTRGRLFERSVY